ncbi:tryptophanyl-tRNA synthetase-like protein [Polyplosphaeria fusca]|uniref:Tryptophan--tRNA ligase, mitochondrial n=1 Tax=Polyplosphaeria fusca TaxID=682080 RepID=A0A9P4QMV9_9PLEO|nr:tryptophanyl-tRNA synthetase-like protein [Polyplosphaeria fusca]
MVRMGPAPDNRRGDGTGNIIFSGIQPTGVPHLGNYLGALRPWVKLQNEAEENTMLFYSIVDLHALTGQQPPEILMQMRTEMMAALYAVGLQHRRSTIFCQSSVPQHAELMWILSCSASMGQLSRMTQWKSKLALPDDASPFDTVANKPGLRLGLFSYPVLQAADILLYRATHVPVGEDQAQHLEFARGLAASFNHAYQHPGLASPPLVPPQTILSPAKRVMSLTDPTKKMSKSDADPKSRILISDSTADINRKINAAVTDSIEGITYDREARPGVSNLIDIMYYMDDSVASSPQDLATDFKDMSKRALKAKVADTIETHIAPIRHRYQTLIENEPQTKTLLRRSIDHTRVARRRALRTVTEVKSLIGIGDKGISEQVKRSHRYL